MHDLIAKIVVRALDMIVGGRSGYGKARWQTLYTRLYDLSLCGMNIGTGSGFETSGEMFCFKYAKKKFEGANGLCVFDVGANIGDYTQTVLDVLPSVTVHAFEPARGTFESLEKRFRGNKNVVLNAIGLSDTRGEAVLYSDASRSGMASVYKRRLDHFDVAMDEKESIELLTIDEYCAEKHLDHIHFLKIDVEGNELRVLEGARRMMAERRIDLIQFEFGGTDIDSRTFFQDFYYLLKDKYGIYRILQDGLYPMDAYSEKDELFVATNFLAERKEDNI